MPRRLRYLTALIAALACFAGPASAQAGTTTTRPLLFSIDGSGTPQGGFSGLLGFGVAINEANGRIYVGDTGSKVVDVFDASGSFLFQLDGSNTPKGSFSVVFGVAVDNSGGPASGNVYVNDNYEHHVLDVFDSNGTFRYSSGFASLLGSSGLVAGLAVAPGGDLLIQQGPGGVPQGAIYRLGTTPFSATLKSQINDDSLKATTWGIDVDSEGNYYFGNGNSGLVEKRDEATGAVLSTFQTVTGANSVAVDRATGTVFAVDGAGISEYAPAGTLVRRFGGITQSSEGMTVDSTTGRVFVVDNSRRRVDVYGPPTSVTVPDVSAGPSTPSYFSAQLSGTIDPQGEPASYRYEYRLQGSSRWSPTPLQAAGSGSGGEPADYVLKGLRHSTTYEARLVGVSTETGAIGTAAAVQTFTTATVPPPTVSAPTGVTSTGATLHGSVNPQGTPVKWRFEYSADGSTWTSAPAAEQDAGSGVADVPVSTVLTGLTPNASYQVRLAATYAGGSGGTATSSQLGFTTDAVAPAVSLVQASRVTDTTARLGASVNPKHAATSYYFQYGEDTSYGSFAPAAQDGDAGAELGEVPAFEKITGLKPDTTYHFCIVAENLAGSTPCEDQTFTTTTTAAQEWPERGFELVSAPDKGSQAVFRGVDGGVLNPPVSTDGQRVVWTVTGGASSTTVGHQANVLATRTPSGWLQQSLNPPADEQSPEAFRYNPFAISRDLKTLVAIADGGFGAVNGTKESALVSLSADHGLTTLIQPFDQEDVPAANLEASVDASTVVHRDGVTGELEAFEGGEHFGPLQIPACGMDELITRQRDSQDYTAVFPGHVVVESPDESNCSGPQQVYVVDTKGGPFTLISGPPVSGPLQSASFLRGNPTGTAVLFTTTTRLAAEDANSGSDLYRWDEGEGVSCLTCGTAAEGVAGGGLTSEDLSHVYMKIPSGPVVWADGDVHSVPAAPAIGENGGQNPAQTTTKITPDGEAILFAGWSGLTADKVPPALEGQARDHRELFLYDDRTRRIECVSCSEDGLTGSNARGFYSFELSADGATAAWTSANPLVPEDINNSPDVYEWHNGVVQLVTDGVTEWNNDPKFTAQTWGISADGRDLIVLVPAPLSGIEADAFNHVYDARVGSPGTLAPTPPAHCVEDACQGPLQAAPPTGAPASSAVSGAGNAVARKAKPKKRKARAKKRAKTKKNAQRRAHSAKQGGNR